MRSPTRMAGKHGSIHVCRIRLTLVENQGYGFLHAAVRVFLKPVPGLYEADRGGDDNFAAPSPGGRQGTVA